MLFGLFCSSWRIYWILFFFNKKSRLYIRCYIGDLDVTLLLLLAYQLCLVKTWRQSDRNNSIIAIQENYCMSSLIDQTVIILLSLYKKITAFYISSLIIFFSYTVAYKVLVILQIFFVFYLIIHRHFLHLRVNFIDKSLLKFCQFIFNFKF